MKLTRNIMMDVLLLLSVVLFGALGYVIIEHWTFFDGLYMTVITLTTIGFGEVHPLSVAGRIFTIVLIFTGIGTITYTIGSISAYLFGHKVYNFIQEKHMHEKIEKLQDHYIVCGASEVGVAVVTEMTMSGLPVILIDRDEEKLKQVASETKCLMVVGDATQDDMLERANIQHAKGLVACFGNDHENVYLIMSARQLNKKLKIYAKVKEDDAISKLKLAGADEIINPYQIGGLRLASLIIRPEVVRLLDELIKDPRQLRVEEVEVKNERLLLGKKLNIEKVEELLDARVIAIKQLQSDKYQYQFSHETIHFESGDSLFVLKSQG